MSYSRTLATAFAGGIAAGCLGATAWASAPVPVRTYEIVTVTRPESVDKHLAATRALYAECADMARLQHLPVQPFPAVPSDYFHERNTYRFDGRSFVERSEHYGIESAGLVPEKGCRTRFVIASLTQTITANKVRYEEVPFEGEAEVREETLQPGMRTSLDASRSTAAAYSVPRTEGGYKLRCLPPGAMLLCILDAGAVLPLTHAGDPVIVYGRTPNVTLTTTLVTTPQTVRVGAGAR